MNRSPQQVLWYDPASQRRIWVRVPESDSRAVELLQSTLDSDLYTETYWYWRELGAPIMHALYRASAVAQKRDLST